LSEDEKGSEQEYYQTAGETKYREVMPALIGCCNAHAGAKKNWNKRCNQDYTVEVPKRKILRSRIAGKISMIK
jgi:hypothetical protein